ncbi:hypothetical protein BPT24_274 [Tenacibaculum phage pT24]|uniref:Uncharacterized protein n=1 Tax=Tenacibaculum phage pT24 TaxID=1880590 RepID=A0A1B4XX60_9CAUD|nr:hypothetical protein HYP10_gp254 [Tenacibaculum phage pT24]BAV39391.1 hypothetical protein BPT24_274 [Tenacibaculum phage pT24]
MVNRPENRFIKQIVEDYYKSFIDEFNTLENQNKITSPRDYVIKQSSITINHLSFVCYIEQTDMIIKSLSYKITLELAKLGWNVNNVDVSFRSSVIIDDNVTVNSVRIITEMNMIPLSLCGRLRIKLFGL